MKCTDLRQASWGLVPRVPLALLHVVPKHTCAVTQGPPTSKCPVGSGCREVVSSTAEKEKEKAQLLPAFQITQVQTLRPELGC